MINSFANERLAFVFFHERLNAIAVCICALLCEYSLCILFRKKCVLIKSLHSFFHERKQKQCFCKRSFAYEFIIIKYN